MPTALMLGLSMASMNGGGGAVAVVPETLIVITLHQSNMNGGQTTGSPALSSPADDAQAGLNQWSPNGGGAYTAGGVEPNPSFARTVIAASGGGLRFSQGLTPNTVGPAYSFMKAAAAANPGQEILIIPGGVGGTDTNEYHPAAGTPTNWPANRYNVIKTAYDTYKAFNANSQIYAFVASILENEIANNRAGVGASQATIDAYLTTVLDTWLAGFRAFDGPGAADAPFILSSPVSEWVSTGENARRYLLGAAKWAAAQANVGFLRRPVGYSVGGDNIHMTNVGNRIVGPELHDHRAVIVALQTTPPTVPGAALTGETLSITSVGTPYYEVWYRAPAGSGDYTKTDFVAREASKVGAVMKMTLPGVGGRDGIIIAKNTGGAGDSQAAPTSGSTPHVTYAVPAVTPPTPVVSIDVDNAVLDGSSNIVSVPSNGSDTTDWIPTAAAGQGATAALKRQLIGSKYGLVLDSTSKSLWRGSAYVFPSGDISVVMPMLLSTQPSTGVFVGCAQTGTNMDMLLSLASSGANFRAGFNTSSVQLLTANAPMTNQYSSTYWRFVAFLYGRTANSMDVYLDDEIVLTGAPTQRSASPANSGGTRFFNTGIDTATGGFSGGTLALPPKVYNAKLTFNELQKIKNDYRTDHGVTFGYSPV